MAGELLGQRLNRVWKNETKRQTTADVITCFGLAKAEALPFSSHCGIPEAYSLWMSHCRQKKGRMSQHWAAGMGHEKREGGGEG